MESRFQVGVISTTHGIGGEVKVYPTTDDAKRFEDLDEVILETKRESKVLHVERVRYFKQMVIVKFREFSDINEVERLRGAKLFVQRKDAVPLAENEYFIADILGIRVLSDEGEDLGILDDVMQTGSNDVYVVKKEGREDLLIPALRDCIRSVDVEAGEMTVHLLPWTE